MNRDIDTFFEVKLKNKKEKTRRIARYALKHFTDYSSKSYPDLESCVTDLLKSKKQDVYDFLQGWINSGLAPRSKRNYFSQVKKYLRYRGIEITSDDVKDELEFPEYTQEELHPVSIDEFKAISKIASFRYRLLFKCQESAMFRVGEGVQLRKKHFITTKKRIMIKIPPTIAKFGIARTTFLDKEAGIMISPILKKLNDDDLVFTKNPNPEYAEHAVEEALRRYIIKLGLDQRYESTNRYKINTHGFRAYGMTKIKRHDPGLSHKLAGQSGDKVYLPIYDRMSEDELLEYYMKYESDLLIWDDSKRDQKMEENSQKMEVMEKRLADLEAINQLLQNGWHTSPKIHDQSFSK